MWKVVEIFISVGMFIAGDIYCGGDVDRDGDIYRSGDVGCDGDVESSEKSQSQESQSQQSHDHLTSHADRISAQAKRVSTSPLPSAGRGTWITRRNLSGGENLGFSARSSQFFLFLEPKRFQHTKALVMLPPAASLRPWARPALAHHYICNIFFPDAGCYDTTGLDESAWPSALR
jgi:hypothetical protein